MTINKKPSPLGGREGGSLRWRVDRLYYLVKIGEKGRKSGRKKSELEEMSVTLGTAPC